MGSGVVWSVSPGVAVEGREVRGGAGASVDATGISFPADSARVDLNEGPRSPGCGTPGGAGWCRVRWAGSGVLRSGGSRARSSVSRGPGGDGPLHYWSQVCHRVSPAPGVWPPRQTGRTYGAVRVPPAGRAATSSGARSRSSLNGSYRWTCYPTSETSTHAPPASAGSPPGPVPLGVSPEPRRGAGRGSGGRL